MLAPFLKITTADMQKFQKNPEYMTRPKVVKIYDVNYTRFSSANKLRYLFKEPSPSEYPLDLNSNDEIPIELQRDTQLCLLQPLLHNYFGKDDDDDDRENNHQVNCNTDVRRHEHDPKLIDVYSRRGILERIMEFCYGKYSFGVHVTRYKGKIFMVERPMKEETFQRQHIGQNQYHRRLTQLTSIDSSPELCNRNDDNIFQIAIHEANLGKYNLHYAGRVEAIKITDESKNDLKQLNKVEFISTKQMWTLFRDDHLKLLRYWLQSYLSNVRELYLAYKDDNGIVQNPMECLKTHEIPKECFWKPSVCVTFLNEFLTKVEEVTSGTDSSDTIFEFNFSAVNKSIQYVKRSGIGFIPKTYIGHIQ